MRKQLVKTLSDIMYKDPDVITLLGDIGIYSFRQVFETHPTRIYNIGILEQATVGVMAGLAMTGYIPVFHTIAPFIAERALEQIKLDFGYQKLVGHFISVGSSYCYPALGQTHGAPGDIQALLSIPYLRIVVPGSPGEFDNDFRTHYKSRPTYYRLSELGHGSNRENTEHIQVKQSKVCILVFGPMLKNVLEASKDLPVDVIYYNVVQPFEYYSPFPYERYIIVSPFYRSTLAGVITEALSRATPGLYSIYDISIPRNYKECYGTIDQHEIYYGLDPISLHTQIKELLP